MRILATHVQTCQRADFFTISSKFKFHGGLFKKSSRSDEPLPSNLLKPFPHCKCQSINSRLNNSVTHLNLQRVEFTLQVRFSERCNSEGYHPVFSQHYHSFATLSLQTKEFFYSPSIQPQRSPQLSWCCCDLSTWQLGVLKLTSGVSPVCVFVTSNRKSIQYVMLYFNVSKLNKCYIRKKGKTQLLYHNNSII